MKRAGNVVVFFAIVGFCLCIFSGMLAAESGTSSAEGGGQSAEIAQTVQQTQPTVDYPSAIMERASSGFTNVVYGPVEIVYQLKEEIKRTDPLRGLIPGLGRGAGWMAAREAVGIFELVTFYLPYKPVLKKFDTEWIYL